MNAPDHPRARVPARADLRSRAISASASRASGGGSGIDGAARGRPHVGHVRFMSMNRDAFELHEQLQLEVVLVDRGLRDRRPTRHAAPGVFMSVIN